MDQAESGPHDADKASGPAADVGIPANSSKAKQRKGRPAKRAGGDSDAKEPAKREGRGPEHADGREARGIAIDTVEAEHGGAEPRSAKAGFPGTDRASAHPQASAKF